MMVPTEFLELKYKSRKKISVDTLQYRLARVQLKSTYLEHQITNHVDHAKEFFKQKGIACFYGQCFLDKFNRFILIYSNKYYLVDTAAIWLEDVSDMQYQFDVAGVDHIIWKGKLNSLLVDSLFTKTEKDSLTFEVMRLNYNEINASELYKTYEMKWEYDIEDIEHQTPVPIIDSLK